MIKTKCVMHIVISFFFISLMCVFISIVSCSVVSAESNNPGRMLQHENLADGIVGAWIWDRDSEDGERSRPPILYYFNAEGTYEEVWWPGSEGYEDFDNSTAVICRSTSRERKTWEGDKYGIWTVDYYDGEPVMTNSIDFDGCYDRQGYTVVESGHEDDWPCELIPITDKAYEEFVQYVASDWADFDYKSLRKHGPDLIQLIQESESTVYNPELAYLLMQVANAAYGEVVNTVQIDEGQVIKGFLEDIGIDNVQVFLYYKNKWDSRYGMHSVAYSIGYNDVDGERIVTIALRGSYGDFPNELTPDWSSNFHAGLDELGAAGWHSGFEAASELVYDEIVSQGLLSTDHTKYVITGHSRGGAVGNLLAVRLSDAGVAKENVFDYNFACPDTNRGWPWDWNPSGVHDNIFNIGYCGDPISMIPGIVLDFNVGIFGGVTWGKYGRSVWYADDWNHFETAAFNFSAHLQSNYLRFLGKKKPFNYYHTWDQMNAKQFANQFEGLVSGFLCPVNVVAKDSRGNVLASAIDGDVSYTNNNDGKVLVFTCGDQKWFFALKDTDVSYELTGTDVGTMKYEIYLTNIVKGTETELKAYSDVPLREGKRYYAKALVEDQGLISIDDNGIPEKMVNPDGTESDIDLSHSDVQISECTYNGKKQKPIVSVSLFGLTIDSSNYEVSYKNNKNVGKAKVTITAKASYAGSITKSFKINPKPVKITKPKASKKAITIKWKKQSAKMSKKHISGYQVQYCTNESFKTEVHKRTIKGYKKTAKKITGLKSKKRYYVRVRSYMKVGGKSYYSTWSKVKTVRTK